VKKAKANNEKAKIKDIEAFKVHSPEQIVIKCARQAYVR
jgi:hypothetical protein